MSIKPALTAEEWEHPERCGGRYADLFVYAHRMVPTEAHKYAALLLYGQLFGFTREDVEMLRNLDRFAQTLVGQGAANLADRIEALLPPEDE